MSVVVIGMEMPRGCLDCLAFTGQGCWIKKEIFHDLFNVAVRPKSCPLRPLPEKHGRLIDADAFEKFVQGKWEQNEISNGDWMGFREWLRDQETIIEAEGGSDE